MNSAHSGDTIIVDPGNYIGNIDISKLNDLNDLALVAASDDPTKTVISANNSAPATVGGVITIKYKTNVRVKGFTIIGASRTNAAGDPNLAGVYLFQSKQCTVENNIFLNDGIGVKVETATGNNKVLNNNFTRSSAVGTGRGLTLDTAGNIEVSQNLISNQNIGIYCSNCRGSLLSGNTISNNANYGIQLEDSRNVNIDGNTLNLDGQAAVYMARSDGNNVTNNSAQMIGYQVNVANTNVNTNAISLASSNSNTISNNHVSNSEHGIFLFESTKNTLQNNRVTSSDYGIAMRRSQNNNVMNNNVEGDNWGIFCTYDDSGNTITGNTANGCVNAGIYLNSFCGENNVVDNNTLTSNTYYGIHVEASKNTISNNVVSGNDRGIFLVGSTCIGNTVSKNIVNNNRKDGIRLTNASSNKVIGNTLDSNFEDGIYLFSSNNSNIDSNIAQTNARRGIHAENSTGVIVNNNTVQGNNVGIRLHITDNSTISKNTASSNTVGIDLNSALNNNIASNFITDNTRGIAMCQACRGNKVYDNYFNNFNTNTEIKNADNRWYLQPPTKGKNIMSGPSIGGNFWASPDGFSQTAPDTNGDGFADTPFRFTNTFDGNIITITDSLSLVRVELPVADFSTSVTSGTAPLTVKFTDNSQNADSRSWDFGDGINSTETSPEHTYSTAGTYIVNLTVKNKNDIVSKLATVTVQAYVAPPITPVADFSANPTSGTAPLTVQFTDSSQNAAGVSWDFGDGSNSNEKNPVHVYQVAGTYTVNMIASNANGTAQKTTIITAQSSSSGGSSHSSGSSGGGGGGSPEPQSNVQVKELSQTFISSGKSVKFDFPQKVTPVVYVSFDSKKTAGKTTTIVEMLKAKSTLVSGLPSGEVYKSLNIWVGNSGFATSKNIENAVVGFKVEKSWIQDKKIDKSSLTLNRYSDKTWNQLPTSMSSEDDTYLYLTAQTTGFSPFAITGKITAAGTIQPAVDKTQPAANVTQSNTNTGSTAANTGQTPGQKESTSPTQKQSTSLPGFEAVFVIAGLLTVFLYRRK